jgi:hypothetical protein
MFDVALRKSTPDDFENKVLAEAEKLKAKGYRVNEIHEVLQKYAFGIIDDNDAAVVTEALEEFSRYLDE